MISKRIIFFVSISFLTAAAWVVGSDAAYAKTCLGKRATVISQSGGTYELKRFETAFFTGKKILVQASGDNRVCSGSGDITVIFGKANKNSVDLGTGRNRVVFQQKANSNYVRSKGEKTTVIFRAKANENTFVGGSGDDSVLVANKSMSTTIDAGNGDNVIDLAARSNAHSVTTGSGDDRIVAREQANALKRTLRVGLGDDEIKIFARGHTTTYLSPQTNPSNISDNDYYQGGSSNDIVFDYSGGTSSEPNQILGQNGADKLHSLGDAYSQVYGGNGSDWLYAASSYNGQTKLFGERGNDRSYADRGSATGLGVYMDGGPGDNQNFGSAGPDTILSMTGIGKIYAGEGDDTILMTGSGIGTIEGGAGYDTLSFAGHTPPGYAGRSGISVDFGSGKSAKNTGQYDLGGFEKLIGSAFDDLIETRPGDRYYIEAGLGDDEIKSNSLDDVDGGLGTNECSGAAQSKTNCDQDSPGSPKPEKIVVDISEDGFLIVYGGTNSDDISIGYNSEEGLYQVNSSNAGSKSVAKRVRVVR